MGASPAAELEPERNRRCCPALELFCITMADARLSRPRFKHISHSCAPTPLAGDKLVPISSMPALNEKVTRRPAGE
jgi:hypothetical protein